MPVQRSELRLVWPAAIFAAEAAALLADNLEGESSLGFLLDEAFYDGRALLLFRELGARAPSAVDPWDPVESATVVADPQLALVNGLIRDADVLPRYEPRRYYRQRQQSNAAPRTLSRPELRRAFEKLVQEMFLAGYFDDSFGSTCCDSRDRPDIEGQHKLSSALDIDDRLWPIGWGEERAQADSWDDDLFYSVVEALHDHVARPRARRHHSFCDEWNYFDFARDPGQALYRWRVNALLERAEIQLRLAESGAERGLLVVVAGDSRDELVRATLITPDPTVRSQVAHAIKLFRSRAAGREDKRSAVVALARLLEKRRELLKEELLSKDEGALFQIANQFDLRHSTERDRGDYDAAFLDWTFWWYLATLELTDRILARDGV